MELAVNIWGRTGSCCPGTASPCLEPSWGFSSWGRENFSLFPGLGAGNPSGILQGHRRDGTAAGQSGQHQQLPHGAETGLGLSCDTGLGLFELWKQSKRGSRRAGTVWAASGSKQGSLCSGTEWWEQPLLRPPGKPWVRKRKSSERGKGRAVSEQRPVGAPEVWGGGKDLVLLFC